ncbi:hypothetical protein WJX73_001063 [Symbiochloris irregularis]|uniref:non-specific serine/threonine protein kinase n=1 Tax=Symbiochloris irregularis TaxID=706552 RepID=A0AAW1NUH3_9CHLO
MPRKQVGSYILGRTLGEGSYAKVKYAQHVDTGEAVAVKVLDKAALVRSNMAASVKREIEIMTKVHHPFVVDLREVFATQGKIYMVMELVPGGELYDQIIANGALQEDRARKLFQGIMDGLDCCHRHGICHRDLKLENILLDADGNPKLSDFGLGALPRSAEQEDGLLRTSCGTPNYVAPEVLARQGYDGFMADLWSLGVCLYVMVAGKLPFEEANMPTLFRKITKADYTCPPWLSSGVVDVLSCLLEPSVYKRATIAKLRRHAWVQQDYVFVDGGARGSPLRTTSGDSDDLFRESADIVVVADSPPGSPPGVKGVKGGRVAGMNAFQLINAALDLSAMFERRADVVHRHTRFTSRAPPKDILDTLEDAVRHIKGASRRKGNTRLKISVQGAKAPLSLSAEVLPVIPGVSMVEVTRTSGDTADFYQLFALLSKALIPSLTRTQSGRVQKDGSIARKRSVSFAEPDK